MESNYLSHDTYGMHKNVGPGTTRTTAGEQLDPGGLQCSEND
jgi:hypothetical protein